MSIRSFLAIGGLLLGLVASQAQSATQSVLDGDADGVNDDRDACPYTPLGISVRPDGCSTPGDEDEDGIADLADACPLSPAGAVVDSQGCALDEDVDGVADGVDRCPMSPLGALVNADGCAPRQMASPGGARRAPGVAAPAARATAPPAPVLLSRPIPVIQLPSQGRPAMPRQATTTAPVPTRPAEPAQVAVPPPPLSQPAATAASPTMVRSEPERTFYFDEGESDLSWGAERAIKQSARDLLPELEKNPAVTLVLSGHSDTKSDGVAAGRMATQRAQAVRAELIAAGVPEQRISLRVPGAGEPRFFGASLARNCRVELRVSGRQDVAPMTVTASPVPAVAAPEPVPVAAPAPVAAARPAPLVPIAPAVAGTAPAPSAGHTPVTFSPYSAMLDDAAMKSIDAFVQGGTRAMLADVTARVVITSGIDPSETGPAAMRLAESRAASVGAYLVSRGLPRNRLEVSTASQTGTRRADLSVVAR